MDRAHTNKFSQLSTSIELLPAFHLNNFNSAPLVKRSLNYSLVNQPETKPLQSNSRPESKKEQTSITISPFVTSRIIEQPQPPMTSLQTRILRDAHSPKKTVTSNYPQYFHLNFKPPTYYLSSNTMHNNIRTSHQRSRPTHYYQFQSESLKNDFFRCKSIKKQIQLHNSKGRTRVLSSQANSASKSRQTFKHVYTYKPIYH